METTNHMSYLSRCEYKVSSSRNTLSPKPSQPRIHRRNHTHRRALHVCFFLNPTFSRPSNVFANHTRSMDRFKSAVISPGCSAKLFRPLPPNFLFRLPENKTFAVLLTPYAPNGMYVVSSCHGRFSLSEHTHVGLLLFRDMGVAGLPV
ncbi:hypothetical protein PMIN04_010620 [Paraphaeosphaeria minitans]